MSDRDSFFQRRKNTLPGILHNSQQRRAEPFDVAQGREPVERGFI